MNKIKLILIFAFLFLFKFGVVDVNARSCPPAQITGCTTISSCGGSCSYNPSGTFTCSGSSTYSTLSQCNSNCNGGSCTGNNCSYVYIGVEICTSYTCTISSHTYTAGTCTPHCPVGWTETPPASIADTCTVSCSECSNNTTCYKAYLPDPETTYYYCNSSTHTCSSGTYSSSSECTSATGTACYLDPADCASSCGAQVTMYYCVDSTNTCAPTSSTYTNDNAGIVQCNTNLINWISDYRGPCYTSSSTCSANCNPTSDQCIPKICPSVNGVCGPANGQVYSSSYPPDYYSRCYSGEIPTFVSFSGGYWTWTCSGTVGI